MGISKVLAAICLISIAISAHADEEPNTGIGSVEEVKRFQRSSGAGDDDLYNKCNAAGSKMVCLGVKDKDDRKARSTCVKAKDCTYMVAIHKDTTNYQFELINFEASNPKNYISVGIASGKTEDSGKQMKDTVIIACHDEIHGEPNPNFRVYWSERQGRPKQVTQERDAILVTDDSHPATANGKLYCKFQTKPSFSIKGHDFYLDKYQYKILLAVGPLGEKDIGYHSDGMSLTETKVSLSKSGGDNGKGTTTGSASTCLLTSFTMITLCYVITKIIN